MNILEVKNDLHRLIVETNDLKILKIIQKILATSTQEQTDWWKDLTEKEKTLVYQGLKESESNILTSNEVVRKGIQQWFQSKS